MWKDVESVQPVPRRRQLGSRPFYGFYGLAPAFFRSLSPISMNVALLARPPDPVWEGPPSCRQNGAGAGPLLVHFCLSARKSSNRSGQKDGRTQKVGKGRSNSWRDCVGVKRGHRTKRLALTGYQRHISMPALLQRLPIGDSESGGEGEGGGEKEKEKERTQKSGPPGFQYVNDIMGASFAPAVTVGEGREERGEGRSEG